MTSTVTTKVCSICSEAKPLEAFSRHTTAVLGVHPECKECRNTEHRRRYAADPTLREACRRRQYKHRYGVTYEEYEQMLAAACCGICGKTSSSRGKLCLDHDHETGRMRGFLCTECNLAIGYFRDDKELLKRAIEYLEVV